MAKATMKFPPSPPCLCKRGGSAQEPCWRLQILSSILLYAVAGHLDKVTKADRLRLRILLIENGSSGSAAPSKLGGLKTELWERQSDENVGDAKVSACCTPSRPHCRRMSPPIQEQNESDTDCLRPFDLHFFSPLNERTWSCTAQTSSRKAG